MKRIIPVALVALVALFSGCLEILSVSPYYRPGESSLDKRILGRWQPSNEKDRDGKLFDFLLFTENAAARNYTLWTSKQGTENPLYTVTPFILGGQLFLDVTPNHDESDYIPGHTLTKVLQVEPSLKLADLSKTWLIAQIKKSPRMLNYTVFRGALEEESKDVEIALLASTEELQTFLSAHVNDPEAWDAPTELIRKP